MSSYGGFILALFICAYIAVLGVGVARDKRPDAGGLFWLGMMLALLSVATVEIGGVFLRAFLRA